MSTNNEWRYEEQEVYDLPFDGTVAEQPRKQAVPDERPFVLPETIQKQIEKYKEKQKIAPVQRALRAATVTLAVVAVATLFLGMWAIIHNYADLYAQKREVKSLETALKDEANLTLSIEEQAENKALSGDIYNRALVELQMKKAGGKDVIVITLSAEAETVSFLPTEEVERSVTYHGFID